jgi:hypothetical protein
MSAADGTVAAPVKVIDNGPGESRWDLVIMGDGYRAAELPKFHDDVEQFCAEVLKPTPPFDELWPAINVHRIDVTSTDSGADLPKECGGTGPPRRTFLDAIFCAPPWHIDRVLTVNNVLAKQVARAVPSRNVILVLVNAEERGGSGDPGVAVSSNAWAWDIAIHELGHSAFNLADEYEGDDSGGPEPKEPNVTRNTNRATNKWKDLVRATTPMPSTCNGGCPRCRPPAHPPAPDAVGAYEGGRYQRCGIYRPFPDCYMRENHVFCPVCARVIRRTFEALMP